MIFIIGGAYQGKLAYAKSAYQLSDDDVFSCSGTTIDFSKRCICRIEHFTRACTQSGLDAAAYFNEHKMQWENSILICQDMFCGVVPMGKI